MTRLRGEFHYKVGGIWVQSTALGAHHTVEFQGCECSIVLPAAELDFDITDEYAERHDIRPLSRRKSWNDEIKWYNIQVLRVNVTDETDLTEQELPYPPYTPEREEDFTRAMDELHRLGGIADDFIQKWTAWIHAEIGQYWIKTSAIKPEMVWTNRLYHASGRRLPVQYGITSVMRDFDRTTALVTETFRSSMDRVAGGALPRVPETLINDAKFLAWATEHPDHRQAVLLAAMACETKVKSVLQELASESQRALVNLVLDNPREVTLAAFSLFDKGLLAVCGISLRAKDKDLFKRVQTLFDHRNNIAHKGGKDVTIEQMRADVQTASECFAWVTSLGSQRSQ